MKKGVIWAIAGIISMYGVGLGLTMQIDKVEEKEEVVQDYAEIPQTEKEVLTVWYWDTALKDAFAVFAEQYPGIELEYVHIPNFEYAEQFRSVLITGGENLPDICMLQDKFAGDFLSMDIWENLEKEPYELDTAVFSDSMQPYMKDRNGNIVAVPYNLAASGLAYRESMMQDVFGLRTPQEVEMAFPDWNSLICAGEEYKNASQEQFYLFSSLGDVATVLFNQTDEPYVVDGRLQEPERFLHYFKILHSLYDKGLVDDITQCSNQWYDEFENGRFLFSPWSMWLNQNKTFSRNEEEAWRLTVPPGGSYKWGGVVCAIPQGSRHKEAAWELIRFLTMSEESARFGKETENSFFLCSSEKYATEEYKSMKLKGFGTFDVGDFYFERLMRDAYQRQLSPYDSFIDVAYHTAVKAIPQDETATPESSYQYFVERLSESLPELEIPSLE